MKYIFGGDRNESNQHIIGKYFLLIRWIIIIICIPILFCSQSPTNTNFFCSILIIIDIEIANWRSTAYNYQIDRPCSKIPFPSSQVKLLKRNNRIEYKNYSMFPLLIPMLLLLSSIYSIPWPTPLTNFSNNLTSTSCQVYSFSSLTANPP